MQAKLTMQRECSDSEKYFKRTEVKLFFHCCTIGMKGGRGCPLHIAEAIRKSLQSEYQVLVLNLHLNLHMGQKFRKMYMQ